MRKNKTLVVAHLVIIEDDQKLFILYIFGIVLLLEEQVSDQIVFLCPASSM